MSSHEVDEDVLHAQIWAIVTNVFLILPVAILVFRDLVRIYMLEAAWFAILAFVSLMHHICDPATDQVWSCNDNRQNVAFTELFFAHGAAICVVMPFVHQRHEHVSVRLRMFLFPLVFFLILVDPTDGFLTFLVLFLILVPSFAWAIQDKGISGRTLFAACGFAIVGFVLYGLANYLSHTDRIDVAQKLWIHGAWHIPISIAMALVLSTLESV